MIFKLTDSFKTEMNLSTSILKGFKYQFGINEEDIDINDWNQDRYAISGKSIIYESNTIYDKENDLYILTIVVDSRENIIDKSYKMLYLLYDDMISQRFDVLMGWSDEGLKLSNNINYIKFRLNNQGQILLLQDKNISHMERGDVDIMDAYNLGNVPNKFMEKNSISKLLFDNMHQNEPNYFSSTINEFGEITY